MLEILICKCSRTLAKCRASAPCERCVATKGSRTAVERGRGEGESIGWIDFTFRFEFQIFYCRQLSKGVAGSAFLLLVISGPKSFKFASFFWTTRKYSILLRTAVWIDNRKYFRTGRRGDLMWWLQMPEPDVVANPKISTNDVTPLKTSIGTAWQKISTWMRYKLSELLG